MTVTGGMVCGTVVPVSPLDVVAMMGATGEPLGAVDTMPVGAVSLAYGVHKRLSELPDTVRTREMAGSSVRVMAPPVAVKGPTVSAGLGSCRLRPELGTGDGMGASMARLPLGSEAGSAPVASTRVSADPVMAEFPRAAAAATIELGNATDVVKPVRLKVSPDAGEDGVIVPCVTTLLRTMLPTGVLRAVQLVGARRGRARSGRPYRARGARRRGGRDVVGITGCPLSRSPARSGTCQGELSVMPVGALLSG